ncbi:putative leader peptide [Pseudonocardia sp. NPDC046786]
MGQSATFRERRHVDLRRQASAICGGHGRDRGAC